MSANAWMVCPKCKGGWKPDPPVVYGEVSEEDYRAALGKKPSEPKETMRLDYEIGIDERGHFWFDFSADCVECHARFHRTHDEPTALVTAKDGKVVDN